MSKKQFNSIANALRAARPHMTPDAYLNLVDEMSYICSQASSTFKPDRFKEACFEESEA
jgi:hypothetical protein